MQEERLRGARERGYERLEIILAQKSLYMTARVSYRIFRKGGENHPAPPTYQETVPITNVLTARIHLWKNSRLFAATAVTLLLFLL